MLDAETYIQDRVDDQISWYSRKSGICQKRYKRLKIITLVFSVTIPFLTGLVDEVTAMKYIIGAMGVVIAAVEGIQSLYKYKDNWLQYRLTSEALKREKLLYQTLSGEYAEASDPFKTFVQRAEQIMAGEQSQWKDYIAKEEQNPSA